MTTQDLIAGYASYTDATQLSGSEGDAAGITPTTTTASSTPCAASIGASIYTTVSKGC
ncbi:LxmA leader domain family RiPP [Nocardioides pantholopis]|uniref:LxmA leader domain family RiPP n=1 Tax=Nocardioides pantholopis TaxID=2483798 RepID=UPI0013DE3A6C|nr:LxmA leader domain family RiPP [Nocardioides pantholopis]